MNKRQFIKTGLLGITAVSLTSKAKALEYYPNPSKKRWAVIYSTWCGSSRDAGIWISEGMNGIANVFDVRENPDLSAYDHIVIGGSIRSGEVSKEMQDFLSNNKALLKDKIRGHFVVCGNMMQPPTEKQTTDLISNHLAQLTGAENVLSMVFLGRVTYGLLDKDSLKMLKGFDMPEYDNLKRMECMAFGKKILETQL